MAVFGIWQLNFLQCGTSDGPSERDWKALSHAPKRDEMDSVWPELFTPEGIALIVYHEHFPTSSRPPPTSLGRPTSLRLPAQARENAVQIGPLGAARQEP